MPSSFDDLHDVLGDIHRPPQDDLPQYWGNDAVRGFKRLYPRSRRKLETSTLYMSNWTRSSRRRRALPLSKDLVQGMAAVALLWGWDRTAAALLIGFT